MATAPTSQEIERVDPIASLAAQSVYDTMDARQLAMLKATRMKKLNDVEIGMALELCRTMALNPWNDEIYATKGNDGELLMMVGRNGLLRKAEEFPDYRGYDAGVVYENDDFSKGQPDPDAPSLRDRAGVRHVQGHPKARGACVGSWAVAEREGRPPRYFFAPMEDYCPSNPHPKSSWARNPTVMIEKVSISVVHRTLTNLSGVYLREEVDKMLERADGGRVIVTAEEEWEAIEEIVADLECDGALKDRLLTLMREMNDLSPASWNLAKVQMTLPGRGEEELAAQATQIEGDVRMERRRAAARKPREEEITEAEVVSGVPVGFSLEELQADRIRCETELEEARTLREAADAEDAEALAGVDARIASLEDELEAITAAEEAAKEQ